MKWNKIQCRNQENELIDRIDQIQCFSMENSQNWWKSVFIQSGVLYFANQARNAGASIINFIDCKKSFQRICIFQIDIDLRQ